MADPKSLFCAVCIDCSEANFSSALSSIILDSKVHSQILLEGPEDFAVLSKFFKDRQSLRCINSHGRGNVTKIIKRLPLQCSNVIGIADRDYDLTPFNNGRIFYYDYNNFEMMLFSHDQIFDHESFYANGKSLIRKQKLLANRDLALDFLYPKSISRLINSRYCSKIHFSPDDVTPHISIYLVQDKNLNASCIKNNIRRQLEKLTPDELKCVIDSYDKEFSNNYNPYDITQGHDFVSLFKHLSAKIIPENGIYSILNNAFSTDLFRNTQLYKSLSTYETIGCVSVLNL